MAYYTFERMGWARWTRKRRNKFKKRWRKNHPGHRFGWFKSEFRCAFWPLQPYQMVIFKVQ